MRLFVCCLLVYSVSVPADTRIGFGSCFNQDKSAEIWKAIGDSDLNGFLFLGDNIYASRNFSRAKLEAAYKSQWSDPLGSLGIDQATWDDHDFGRHDGVRTLARTSQSTYFGSFPPTWMSLNPRRRRLQFSDSYDRGDQVQIIALDTRSFRADSSQHDPQHQAPSDMSRIRMSLSPCSVRRSGLG